MPRGFKQQTCYMCEKHATTREHAPCKSFFPENFDPVTGINYRRNLITVPSCTEHNASKSEDDEYLLFIILSAGANAIARRLFSTKVMHALSERTYLVGLITRDMIPAFYNGTPTMAFTVDHGRFTNSTIHLARALYYYHYHKKWLERIEVYSPALLQRGGLEAQSMNAANEWISRVTEKLFQRFPQYGDNSRIFYYNIHRDKEAKQISIRMVFYEGIVIVAVSSLL